MFLRRACLSLAAACLAIAQAAPASAHPHVWIDVHLNVVFDDEGRVSAIRQHWDLDWAFTNVEVIPFVDADRDGTLGPPEVERALLYYFGFVNEYRYFTRLTVDGTTMRLDMPAKPEVSYADGYFTLNVELPLRTPVPITESAGIDVFDPDIYYWLDFPHEGYEHPSAQPTPPAPVVQGSIVTTNAPPGCSAGLRPPETLDPMAVALLRRLGLTAINDDAAGFPARAIVVCRPAAAAPAAAP